MAEPDREDFIAWFCPADLQTVHEASWVVQPDAFPFANDGIGNFYTVTFGPDPSQPSKVCISWHEGGDVEEVANSLETFLSNAQTLRTSDE